MSNLLPIGDKATVDLARKLRPIFGAKPLLCLQIPANGVHR
jgi:hypothetical protein